MDFWRHKTTRFNQNAPCRWIPTCPMCCFGDAQQRAGMRINIRCLQVMASGSSMNCINIYMYIYYIYIIIYYIHIICIMMYYVYIIYVGGVEQEGGQNDIDTRKHQSADYSAPPELARWPTPWTLHTSYPPLHPAPAVAQMSRWCHHRWAQDDKWGFPQIWSAPKSMVYDEKNHWNAWFGGPPICGTLKWCQAKDPKLCSDM